MSTSEQPLINKKIQLEKFPGKGGWTYARLEGIAPVKKNPFGWRKVKGYIDEVEIKQYHLMPMGNGELFLPVKSAIRKQIKKEAGDFINIILYNDDAPTEIPEDFIICLQDEPKAWKHFQNFSDQDQKKYIDWVYALKSEGLKIDRMAKAINQIAKGELFLNK